LRLSADDWRQEQLEPHLFMILRIVDHAGKVLGQGRDPAMLERRFADAANEGAKALGDAVDAKREVSDLPETPLDDSLTTTQAGIRVAAYPALTEGKGPEGLTVELFDHPNKALEAHRHGIKRLAMQRLPDQLKAIKRLPKL